MTVADRVQLEPLPDRTMERIRDYVARESLAGRQTSVAEVVERELEKFLDEQEGRKV